MGCGGAPLGNRLRSTRLVKSASLLASVIGQPITGNTDYDRAAVKAHYRFLAPGMKVNETGLRKLRLVADDEDNVARITVSEALLCCQSPTDWIPHAYVQAVRYAGERRDVNYQTDARNISGPLGAQIFETFRFVRRNMLVRATKKLPGWTALSSARGWYSRR